MTIDMCDPSSDLFAEYYIYLIDSKGNLQAVKLTLDQQSFELKVERERILQNSSLSKSKATDFFDVLKRIKFLGSERNPSSSATHSIRRKSLASTNSVSTLLRGPSRISIGQVQEIRLSYYDLKAGLIKTDELNKCIPFRTGSFKSPANNLRMLKIFFGNEFNLQCHQFLVIGMEEVPSQQHPLSNSITCQLQTCVEYLRSLVKTEENQNYFQLLDRWYKKEFTETEKTGNSVYRLQLWHQFLHRNHHGLPIQLIQEHLSCLDAILKDHSKDYDTKPINLQEFISIARYFTHSKECIARIFGNASDNPILPDTKLCEDSSEDIVKLFQSYWQYITTIEEKYLPNIIGNLDIVTVLRGGRQRMKNLMKNYMKHTTSLAQEKCLSSFYILDYLYSPHNNIWLPEKQALYQDMTQPLCHYFIASSHNTYLTGNQYKSKSSCEAYARVLRQGCRCIEIDVWDGPKNKPIVKHGNTMTTAVKLKDILTTIKEHAFVISPYPIIISIENHCSIKQQKAMAKYFWRIFGTMLFTGTIEDKSNDGSHLPSPEDLKHRIILKGRTLPSRFYKECSSIKEEVRSGLKCLKSISDSAGNRESNATGNSNVSSYVEANSSEFLLVGELLMKNEKKIWTPQMFLLNSKTMLYIEEEHSNRISTRRSQLPSFPIIRQSLSLAELAQELHQDQMWFHGQLSGGHNEVNEILRKKGVQGSFLVWENKDLPEKFILSVFYPNNDSTDNTNDANDDIYHVPIHNQIDTLINQTVFESKYFVDYTSMKFNSIFELISYYQHERFKFKAINLEKLGPAVEVSLSKTHESMEWFYKDMDRTASEKVLRHIQINGLFLGRYKDEKHSEIVISFRCDNQIRHCGIKRDGRYLTISNLKFRKLEELVQYYGATTFYKNIKLKHHLTKRLYDMIINDKQVDENILSSSVDLDFTVDQSTCTVRAIQNYETSEPNILSFKKGDIIINVTKDQDGWWTGAKADCPTERKQFCSSFVEEVDNFRCPFEGYTGTFIWKLGVKASIKTCRDRTERKNGITHYIVFEDEDGSKRKLGTACQIVAKEWVDMINVVIEQNEEMKIKLFQAKDSKVHKIATELSDLIWFGNARESETLENSDAVDNVSSTMHASKKNIVPIKSFSESIAQYTFSADETFWMKHHKRCLTRIYPKGLRLNSSNFNPMNYWCFGSQLVALNYQTPDKGMQINRGMFQQNGGCGYVLKPEVLFNESDHINLFSSIDSTQKNNEFIITIEVIGGRHLRKESPGQMSPFVEIEIIGVDKDCKKAKTCRQQTGLKPCWNEEFQFTIYHPDLALVQFRIYEEDSFSDKIFLGESTMPVSCIRQGNRSIQLNNEFGTKLFSRLLVKVTVKNTKKLQF